MITLDIFNNDAFSVTTLLPMVNKMPFQPSFLGSLGIFDPTPVSTNTIGVGMLQGRLALIQTSLRGAPVEPAEAVFQLLSDETSLDELIVQGLRQRPELASAQELVQATLLRLKQAR